MLGVCLQLAVPPSYSQARGLARRAHIKASVRAKPSYAYAGVPVLSLLRPFGSQKAVRSPRPEDDEPHDGVGWSQTLGRPGGCNRNGAAFFNRVSTAFHPAVM